MHTCGGRERCRFAPGRRARHYRLLKPRQQQGLRQAWNLKAKEKSELGWRRSGEGRELAPFGGISDFRPAVSSWAGPEATGLRVCPKGGIKRERALVALDSKFFH